MWGLLGAEGIHLLSPQATSEPGSEVKAFLIRVTWRLWWVSFWKTKAFRCDIPAWPASFYITLPHTDGYFGRPLAPHVMNPPLKREKYQQYHKMNKLHD